MADTPARAETLVAHNIAKVYGSGEVQLWALRGVDFELYERELVVLLGPSGSGKTSSSRTGAACDRSRDEYASSSDGEAWAVFVTEGGRVRKLRLFGRAARRLALLQ